MAPEPGVKVIAVPSNLASTGKSKNSEVKRSKVTLKQTLLCSFRL